MTSMIWIGALLLLGIGAAILAALLSVNISEDSGQPAAVAVLPVPEDTPSARAFLEYYASQISWMDARILHCVILVGTEQTMPLCRELARDYSCFAAMSLPDVQAFLAEQCAKSEKSGKL